MKKMLVAGDSFFCTDEHFAGQHFSEMFGEDVQVTNVSGPGFSNTAIFSQILYALMQETFDYCVIGFTAILRLPIKGNTKYSLSPMHVQWRSTSSGDLSSKERLIADQFLAITVNEPFMISDLALVDLTLQMLKEKNIQVAWMLGGLHQVKEEFNTDSITPMATLINRIASNHNDRMIPLDYWSYPKLVASPIYHIDDLKYQKDIATKISKKLGL